jgi:hypothetical protein
MAQQHLDVTGNEHHDKTISKIEANFSELYDGTSPEFVAITTDALVMSAGTKKVTATTSSVTLNKASGVVTTEALTTAAGAAYTLAITSDKASEGDIVLTSVTLPPGAHGVPVVSSVRVDNIRRVLVTITNVGTAAFNSTLNVAFAILKV